MNKILIIEDEAIIAHDLQSILEQADYEVCEIADNYEDALNLYHSEKPDMIISDIFIKGLKSGIDIINDLNHSRQVPVIFITAFSNDEIINTVSEFHKITYLTKPFTDNQVLATVKMLFLKMKKATEIPKISTREKAILEMISNGKNSNEIADLLQISAETVKTYRKRLFQKFNVTNAAQLTKYIVEHDFSE